MRKITFDIETKNTFFDVGSRDARDLDLSVVCIHDSSNDSYSCYLEEELPELFEIIERADILIGFNSDHFDIPLLDKYYPGDLMQIKSVDIMKEIQISLGRRIGLDAIAEATLGVGKSGHGLQAITWWKNGEIQKIKDYCIQDVKVTKDIYDFARKEGYLCYKKDGEKNKIPVETAHWEVSDPDNNGMAFTLPF